MLDKMLVTAIGLKTSIPYCLLPGMMRYQLMSALTVTGKLKLYYLRMVTGRLHITFFHMSLEL